MMGDLGGSGDTCGMLSLGWSAEGALVIPALRLLLALASLQLLRSEASVSDRETSDDWIT